MNDGKLEIMRRGNNFASEWVPWVRDVANAIMILRRAS
jgi:hypothetical protein